MEENKIYLINQINLNKIIYSKVNEMNDKKLIHIYYEKPGQKLLFQTPQLLNLFDIQKNDYFNELVLPLHDCNLKVPLFIKLLRDLDLKIIDDARINKNEWFKNKTAIRYKSLIKNLYTNNSSYKPSNEEEKCCTNGLIKLKLTNGIKILEDNNEIKLDDLKKNNFIRMIVELYAVWISGDVFGLYLKPVMIEQIKNKVLNFIDEKEDVTEVNYLETEANSEDEYIDNNQLVIKDTKKDTKKDNKKDNKKYKKHSKTDTSEESNNNLNLDNDTKMYHFGLHDVNEDLFNTLKKDKKIVSILSELNSNNTRKDLTLSEMSSEIEEEKHEEEEEEDEEEDNERGSDQSSNSETSETSEILNKINTNKT
jgi:CRISPR/Cas system-associated endoribonuclease Cas2